MASSLRFSAYGHRKFEACHHLGATTATRTALSYFRRLFDIEDLVRQSRGAARRRAAQSNPIVDDFHPWLRAERLRHVPSPQRRECNAHRHSVKDPIKTGGPFGVDRPSVSFVDGWLTATTAGYAARTALRRRRQAPPAPARPNSPHTASEAGSGRETSVVAVIDAVPPVPVDVKTNSLTNV